MIFCVQKNSPGNFQCLQLGNYWKQIWVELPHLGKPVVNQFGYNTLLSHRKQKCGDQEVECVVKIKGKGIVVSAVASNYKAAKKAASKKALSEL